MIRRLLNKLTVSRRGNLDRYYLLKWRGWGLFLHEIHHDEREGVYHSHPWWWVSLVFGRYYDHRLWSKPGHLAAGLNWCLAGEPHRVTLYDGKPVWTLLLHAPRSCRWAVYDKDSHVLEVEPWRGTSDPERKEYI